MQGENDTSGCLSIHHKLPAQSYNPALNPVKIYPAFQTRKPYDGFASCYRSGCHCLSENIHYPYVAVVFPSFQLKYCVVFCRIRIDIQFYFMFALFGNANGIVNRYDMWFRPVAYAAIIGTLGAYGNHTCEIRYL